MTILIEIDENERQYSDYYYEEKTKQFLDLMDIKYIEVKTLTDIN